MNVIGIVQTDLNEFNILFEQDQKEKDKQSNGDNNDSGGFSLFGMGQDSDGGSDQGDQQQKQNNEQEMTVRIKGIPEGQKATFLQMYQIIQDAKETKDIKSHCTVVSDGDQNGNENGNNQGGSGRQGASGWQRGSSGSSNFQ
ncbi:hypothetical protein [Brevibacillus sp. SYSU BS000544]|uniref:hypothetical protein n=1 Tax=Brevibacillus sp. SYSU BS000544 TaxID=3416443 RepID=UPI003CE45367